MKELTCGPFDPLAPDHAHDPADGTSGIVVGDDTGRLPRVRVRRSSPWLVIALTLLVVLTLAVVAAVTVPAHVPALRAPAALIDRCCAPRPPVASLLPAVTPQPDPEGIPA